MCVICMMKYSINLHGASFQLISGHTMHIQGKIAHHMTKARVLGLVHPMSSGLMSALVCLWN